MNKQAGRQTLNEAGRKNTHYMGYSAIHENRPDLKFYVRELMDKHQFSLSRASEIRVGYNEYRKQCLGSFYARCNDCLLLGLLFLQLCNY
ncbi:unnamed protein product [Calypogeia fissa]